MASWVRRVKTVLLACFDSRFRVLRRCAWTMRVCLALQSFTTWTPTSCSHGLILRPYGLKAFNRKVRTEELESA
jgi:hypothetical protein